MSMNIRFDNKVAVVTGGTAGIGDVYKRQGHAGCGNGACHLRFFLPQQGRPEAAGCRGGLYARPHRYRGHQGCQPQDRGGGGPSRFRRRALRLSLIHIYGMLVTNPIPEKYSMDHKVIDKAIEQALAEAKAQGIHGKETTPFLLAISML